MCNTWLKAADAMREQLFEDGEGFDPFQYNETATVGFLVAAAGRAGMFALPEFTEQNRKLPEGRFRAGRCDLWLASEDLSIDWLIEFKLCWYGRNAKIGLITPINNAIDAVFDRDRGEADDRWGCVVYNPNSHWFAANAEERALWKSPSRIKLVARAVDFAFEMDGPAGPCHVLMKKIPPRARQRDRYNLSLSLLD
jgi:hypothetical protein